MVDQETFLQVRRSLRSNVVDRTEALDGRDAAVGTEWIQDNTGRVTEQSQDNDNNANADAASASQHNALQQEEALPDGNPHNPVVVFSPNVPYYPTGYSCEHLFQLPQPQQQPQYNTNEESSSSSQQHRDDLLFMNLPQAMDTPHLNSTAVPIAVEFLLPHEGEILDASEVEKNIEAMEWSLLNLVVDTTGLSKNCHIDRQFDTDGLHPQHRGRGLTRNLESSLPYPTSIFKVASDSDGDKTQWKARCSGNSSLEYNQASSSCFTLQTALAIKYRGSKEESNIVSEYVQNIIHNQIAVDPSRLFVMDIEGLHWVDPRTGISNDDMDNLPINGNTTKPFDPSDLQDIMTQDTNTSNKSIWSGLSSPQIYIPVATGIFVLLIWIAIHLFTRNRRCTRSSKTASISQASKEQRPGIDIESGSVNTEPTVSPANSGPEGSSEFGSPDPKPSQSSTPSWEDLIGSRSTEKAARRSVPALLESQIVSLKAVRRSVPVSVDSPDRKPLPVSVDSPDRSAAGLPPRPPQQPRMMPRRNSIKLKKRRRKKKKSKKVAALRRVNSRENINEMPMISESDEDSELGSEDGSEYTSDDGSVSHDTSSGCITPSGSRSLSQPSSHASSPQRSLADEDEDFDQNVEFVIEAPDFPNLLDGEHEIDERDIGNTTNGVVLEPRTRMRKSLSDDKLAQRLTKELNKLEIEPRSKDESVIEDEDGDSPKRRIPLPWLK